MKNRSPTGTAFPGQNYCESRVSEPVGTFSELPSPLSERIVLRDRYLRLALFILIIRYYSVGASCEHACKHLE
jgi:hypothetical protein